jgi:hypothetical protein
MSVLTDGYNCENKNVHVRGEESKLITDIESGLAGMGSESSLERTFRDLQSTDGAI